MVARFKNWIKQLRGTHGIVVSRDLDLKDERLELTQTAAGITSWEWNIVTDEMTWTAGRANLVRLGKEPRLRFQDVIANVHPSDRQPTLKAAHTAVATKTDYKCEFRVPTPAGSYRWILSRGKVFYDLTGNPLRMLGVNMDITDRKQLEESIVEEKERFRAIFEQTAIGVGYVLLKQPCHTPT